MVSSDENRELGVDATYVRNPRDAAGVVKGAWDGVFIGNDEVGQAYISALHEHYKDTIADNEQKRKAAWAESKNFNAPRIEGCPDLHYFHNQVDVPRMLWQDLGASCWTCQNYFFKPGKDEILPGSEADLEEILKNIY